MLTRMVTMLSIVILEQHFDGNTQMYEGLQQLEDGLIDYIEIIQTVKSMVKKKLRDGNFGVDKEIKDKLFYADSGPTNI